MGIFRGGDELRRGVNGTRKSDSTERFTGWQEPQTRYPSEGSVKSQIPP